MADILSLRKLSTTIEKVENSDILFFDLLSVALGLKTRFTRQFTSDEWALLFEDYARQGMLGIGFVGITRLPEDLRPEASLLEAWEQYAIKIKKRNIMSEAAISALIPFLHEKGVEGVILKGQGLAGLFKADGKNELGIYRTSGDIDFLVTNVDGCFNIEERIKRLTELARQNDGLREKSYYHHCDFGKIKKRSVELHWRASWFYCPWYNRRFQKFCQDNMSVCDNAHSNGGFPTPSLAFNRIFVLVHIYRHIYGDGIGLRQIIDYYFVLLNSFNDPETGSQEKMETMTILKSLGMARFTAAIMWILSEKLCLPDDRLLCSPNEKDGQFLLSEVLNFGKENIEHFGNHVTPKYAFARISRIFHLFRFGPLEVLSSPFWKLWHLYYWMPKHGGRSPQL